MSKTEYLNNKAFEVIILRFQKFEKQKEKFLYLLEDLKASKERKLAKNEDVNQKNLLISQNENKLLEMDKLYKNAKEDLAFAFKTLSENIAGYAKFSYIEYDDAVQEGVIICLEKVNRFNPNKGKAFNYMTTCILNQYRQNHRNAKNYNELKKRFHDVLNMKIYKTIIRNGKDITIFK